MGKKQYDDTRNRNAMHDASERVQALFCHNRSITSTLSLPLTMMRPFPLILAGIAVVSVGTYATIAYYQQPDVVFPLGNTSSSLSSTERSSAQTSVTSVTSATSSTITAASSIPAANTNEDLPASVRIDVPFASQAPLQNWDALHQEACEEASLILVKYFLEGKTITPQTMEDEIQKLVAWETANGYKIDVDTEELLTIAKELYGLNGRIVTDVSVESLKRELAAGNPVIIPAAGQTLGNPYFSGDGPPYHMLVVVGYDSKNFITNDVGTRRGEGYKYDYDTLINAIHDWNGSTDTILSGPKRMLVITK